MEFLRTLGSVLGIRRMFLGFRALRRHCAVRIQGTCTPRNAIAKTRYLPQRILHPRVLRGSPGPDVPLPQPPVDRITSNRCEKPRTDLPLIRDFSPRILIFIIPLNFSEKVISSHKRVFLTFRGTFGPQGSPTGTWKCSHSIRHRIPDISMRSVVT